MNRSPVLLSFKENTVHCHRCTEQEAGQQTPLCYIQTPLSPSYQNSLLFLPPPHPVIKASNVAQLHNHLPRTLQNRLLEYPFITVKVKLSALYQGSVALPFAFI